MSTFYCEDSDNFLLHVVWQSSAETSGRTRRLSLPLLRIFPYNQVHVWWRARFLERLYMLNRAWRIHFRACKEV
jgi:hypothetical protein